MDPVERAEYAMSRPPDILPLSRRDWKKPPTRAENKALTALYLQSAKYKDAAKVVARRIEEEEQKAEALRQSPDKGSLRRRSFVFNQKDPPSGNPFPSLPRDLGPSIPEQRPSKPTSGLPGGGGPSPRRKSVTFAVQAPAGGGAGSAPR